MFSFVNSEPGGTVGFIVCGLVLWAPRFFLKKTLVRYEYSYREKFEKFTSELGEAKYLEYQNRSGIAVAGNGDIVLSEGDFTKSYPKNAIREWQKSVYERGVVSGGGLAGLAVIAQEEARAKAGTGLFISVRDVERPQWHIQIRDQGTLTKWMEILRQEIND